MKGKYKPLIIFSPHRRMLRYVFLLLPVLYINGCKETETPENPYDKIDYSSGGNNQPEPDPVSIIGLHKNIFSKKCALSGCHDGTFEPDFRTVQSTYSSLVYHPVIKDNVDNVHFFSYRVVPNDVAKSFIIERLTTPTSDYMPSNGTRLQTSLIENIKTWISNGARDEDGNLPVKPDLLPNILGYASCSDLTFSFRYDTTRLNNIPYYSFIAPQNTLMYMPVLANDDADSADATPVSAFTNCRMEFSLTKDGFPSTNIVNSYLHPAFPIWVTNVNTAQWTAGTTVYFRFYINDGHHTSDTEFPRTSSLDFYKTYCSFYVQ